MRRCACQLNTLKLTTATWVQPRKPNCVCSLFFCILLLLSKGVCHVALQMLCDYWMRLIMIPWIIKLRSKVSVEPEGEANDTDTRLDNSSYHTKTELNNCSIVHFKTIYKKNISLWSFKSLRTPYGQGAWKLGRLWTRRDKCNICWRCCTLNLRNLPWSN